jgi:methionine sulfoxide reductase heme-binding subunit
LSPLRHSGASRRAASWTGRLLWVLLPAPAVALIGSAFAGRLGANPGEALILETGEWTLRFLLLTLAATPVAKLTGWGGLVRHRRLLGVWTAVYAGLHLLAYAWLDQALDLGAIAADVLERPFIAAGMLAAAILAALAATSFDGAVRRLGARRWRALHRGVYLAGAAALLHFWWKVTMGKEVDYTEPAVYAAIFAALLLARLVPARRPAPRAAR